MDDFDASTKIRICEKNKTCLTWHHQPTRTWVQTQVQKSDISFRFVLYTSNVEYGDSLGSWESEKVSSSRT
eukprot:CAMPEP_0185788372 /NCGR_PEP_ID=MMETSP1174-20130828/145759_1 /TAXON_ID=35687 /ORGANISM="Dictyocha speculum, Strain CCMP1381" /LENGTH=70 /DNA_ID=CAMNT_0028482035 /DNA_START=448 /DNA_END=660 /DNA_ORIENTATION=+